MIIVHAKLDVSGYKVRNSIALLRVCENLYSVNTCSGISGRNKTFSTKFPAKLWLV